MIHQSGLASPGWGRKAALAGNAAFGIGDGAVLFSPAGGWEKHVGVGRRVGVAGAVGYDDEGAGCQRPVDPVGVGQADGGVGRHDPQRLDLPGLDRLEQIDGLQAFARRHARRLPEAADAVDGVRGEAHMGRQLVGEPADLAPAHGVGLAGDRERTHAGPPDPAGGEVAIEDGVDLVGAARRLVDALGIDGHGGRCVGEQAVEFLDLAKGQAAAGCNRVHVAGVVSGGQEGLREIVGLGGDEVLIHRPDAAQMGQQAVEQQHVAAGPDRQMQVGGVAGGGTARVDHDDAGAALRLGADKALVEDGMAPCEVAADQHDQIGKLQILVIAGNHVAAEGAAVAGDAGRHAQAGIGVDIGAADEAFHQLVGDVVVFGQQLAGDVEGDRIRAVLGRSLR